MVLDLVSNVTKPLTSHARPSGGPRRWAGPLLLAVSMAAALPLLEVAKIELGRRRIAGRYTAGEAYYLPPARVLRALSFGFNELAADLVWLRTIAYFADHLRGDRDFAHLKRYLDTAISLDPSFKELYRFGSSMLLARGASQTNADVFAAIDLAERGHALFPDDPDFPLRLGTSYLNELRSPSKAQRDQWRRRGADWIRRAAAVGVNVPWLPALAAKVYTEQGQRELAIRHLKELYLITSDEATRRHIEIKLRTLEVAQLVELRAEAETLDRAYRASALRFVPRDLHVLVDLPPLRPFSLASVLDATR